MHKLGMQWNRDIKVHTLWKTLEEASSSRKT